MMNCALKSTGGNLPVDSAVFLGKQMSFPLPELLIDLFMPDFIPASHQYLLTVLSIWWCLGQLVCSLVSLTREPSALL